MSHATRYARLATSTNGSESTAAIAISHQDRRHSASTVTQRLKPISAQNTIATPPPHSIRSPGEDCCDPRNPVPRPPLPAPTGRVPSGWRVGEVRAYAAQEDLSGFCIGPWLGGITTE